MSLSYFLMILIIFILVLGLEIFLPKWKQQKIENESIKSQQEIANTAQSKKLHIYISSIIRNLNDITHVDNEDNARLITAINDSIDKILLDDIQPSHFLAASVQSEKNTIFDYLQDSEFAEQIIFQRLKNLFSISETMQDNVNDEAAIKQLRRKTNEIFSYVLELPQANDEEKPVLEEAISHSLDEILQDSDIKTPHYQDALVQSDIALMLEYLAAHNLTNRLVVKRLKNLFLIKNA